MGHKSICTIITLSNTYAVKVISKSSDWTLQVTPLQKQRLVSPGLYWTAIEQNLSLVQL